MAISSPGSLTYSSPCWAVLPTILCYPPEARLKFPWGRETRWSLLSTHQPWSLWGTCPVLCAQSRIWLQGHESYLR